MTRPLMEIVLSSDDKYFQHLSVAVASILENNRSNGIRLHVVHSAVSPENIKKVRDQVAEYDEAQIAFYEFDTQPYEHFRLDGHISLASYFRLFLGDLLPTEVEKVIYLDVDLVVLSDLAPLWTLDLEGCWIAAAPDPYANSPDLFANSTEDLPSSNERLGLPPEYIYFNAGVLLIDLARWRREGLRATFVDYVNQNQPALRFHDQDVLNALLCDRVKYLEYNWNFHAKTRCDDVASLGISKEAFASFARSPRIVHFTTRKKPWFYQYQVPFEGEYYRYLKLTPWRGYVAPDRTTLRVVGRKLPLVRSLYQALKSSR